MQQHQAPDFMEIPLSGDKAHQAVKIPVEFSLDADRVRIHREGERLVLEPVHAHPLRALLDRWQRLPDEFPEIEDTPAKPEDIF